MHNLQIHSTLIIVCCILISKAQDNSESTSRGMHFIVGFISTYPDRLRDHFNITLISFSSGITNVALNSDYLINGQPYVRHISLSLLGYERVRVPNEFEMVGSSRTNKFIQITADADISVHVTSIEEHTSDGYLALPTKYLANKYVVASYISRFTYKSLFAILSIEACTVTVQLADNVTFEGNSYTSGDTLELVFNKSEAVQILSSGDLTGSIIISNKPIVVINGHQCAANPNSACDFIMEQLIPVEYWGTTHIYTELGLATDFSLYRMVAFYNDTKLAVGSSIITLQSGEFWEGSLTGNGVIITSKPASLSQIMTNIDNQNVDPSLIQVASENHYAFRLEFTTPGITQANNLGFINYVNIIVKASESASVVVRNSNNTFTVTVAKNTPVPGTDYAVLVVSLPRQPDLYHITQSIEKYSPMSAIAYGYEYSESYGYLATLAFKLDILEINPLYVRETGGEVQTIAVASNFKTEYDNVLCRYNSNIEVRGTIVIDNTVRCITPLFNRIGYISIEISYDNGGTYPIRGTTYVARQDVLPPQLSFSQGDNKFQIDFNSQDPVTLTWNSDLFPENELQLAFRVLRENENEVEFQDISIANSIPNSGNLQLQLSSKITATVDSAIGGDICTGFFFLTPSLIIPNFRCAYIAAYLAICYVRNTPKNCLNTEALKMKPAGVIPCPCLRRVAIDDRDFIEETTPDFFRTFFHPGADTCFRSRPSSSGSGQQCCYRADENILLDTDGRGTPDTISPEGTDSTAKHFIYDVVPWFLCCKLSDNCNHYFEHRPADDCTDYVPPNRGWTNGDPHFTSLDGHSFTFNGAGEFLLSSSPLYDFTLQARMEIFQNSSASVYSGFVMQTNYSDKIQVHRLGNGAHLFINKMAFQLDENIITKQTIKGGVLQIKNNLSEVVITFDVGIAITIYISQLSMSFILQMSETFRGRVEGLLGNFNGVSQDDLMLPNGTTINTSSSLQDIHYNFGLQWMVSEQDSIFEYIPPFNYNSYYKPFFLPSFVVPNIANVSEEIRQLCGTSIPCLFDAVHTEMISFANETITFEIIKEDILNNSVKRISCGYPNTIANGSYNDSVYLAGRVLEFSCNPGYILNGPAIIVCNMDGKWPNIITTCLSTPTSTSTSTSIPTPTSTPTIPPKFTFYDSSYFYVHDSSYVHVYDSSFVYVYNSSYIYVYNPSFVYVYNSSYVYFYDPSFVYVYNSSYIYAYDPAFFDVYNSSYVYFYDPSFVYVYNSSYIYTYDSSFVHVYNSSYIYAYDSSFVDVYNSSYIYAYVSSFVDVYDSSYIYTYDSTFVDVYKSSYVYDSDSSYFNDSP